MDERYYQPIEENIRVIHRIKTSNKMKIPHFHNHFEIHFTLSYNLKFIIGNRIFNDSKGSVFALENFVPHITVAPDDAWFEGYIIHISPEILQEINQYKDIDFMELFQSGDKFSHIKLKPEAIPEFEQILDRQIKALKNNFYGAEIYRRLLLTELLLFLIRVKHEKQSSNNEIYDDENGILVKRIMDFITDNITMDLHLIMLEKTFFINRYSISRLFKEYCGVTVNQYIISRRIYLACELLKQNRSVYKVCELSGFFDYGHFIRTFKKHVGISPKQYALQYSRKNYMTLEN